MKAIIYSFLIALLVGSIVLSCEEADEDNQQMIFSGQLISNSACKSDLRLTPQIIETPDSLSCVEYSFDRGENKLTLKHVNAGFNCCPDRLYCIVELKGDTIQIQEFEEETEPCHCNCLYDLDIEVNGVDPKNYQIKFIEPYVSDWEKLIFEIDLTDNTNGSFCVTRKQYPWGMGSLNE